MRPLQKSVLKLSSILAAGTVLAAVAGQQLGCSSDKSPGGPSASANEGTLGMSLTIPGGESINTITYTITGPNLTPSVVAQSIVNVQNSQALNFIVGGIPSGSGYTITISGTTTDGLSTCVGAATFSVTARTTTNVTVNLQCNQGAPDAGSVAVGGQLYACANANFVTAIPAETTVGTALALTGSGNGPNAAALTYSWSAPTGAFSAPNAASTNFTCTAPGPVTVTLTVGDGPVPAGATCSPSAASTTVQIVCDPTSDAGAGQDATVGSDAGPQACNLGPNGAIKHVIYVQFDNTHLAADEPNVASDLMQMPALLGFIRGNGTMMGNDHTVLISHTGGGILSTLTGLYPDRHGQTVSNSYVRTSTAGKFSFPSTFQYWTNTVATGIYNLTQPDGTNTPAPWIPYTKAGCNFGGIAVADLELENVSTSAFGDITTVFGANSPQWNEAKANSSKAVTDFEGIAVHCAQGSSVCAAGEADVLPASQNYSGFSGLFGTQQINPVLVGAAADGGTAPVIDMLGNPITDSSGNPGFPGFNGMTAAVSLAYIASMQEHGIPVTFAYVSDAHDNHVTGSAYGPGQQGYEQQLAAYNTAFANFFTRLAADGINQSNTLFVFTVDEGDQFVGTTPSPSTCDGTPGNYCSYTLPDGGAGLGEVNVNVDLLVSSEAPSIAPSFVMGNNTNPGAPYDFTVHGDDAPTFYLSRVQAGDAGQTTGPLAQTDPMARAFERAAAGFTLVNPYTNNTDTLLFRMADQAGMQALHMMTPADPARNPTFVYFANDTYYITDYPSNTCADCIQPGFAWNHGDDQSIIGQTWLGIVGPGVVNQNNGPDQTVFTDHTDVRPTMLSVLGLQDSYVLDGRVITQALLPSDYSSSLAADVTTVQTLGDAYKQINAPFDAFAQCILSVSTTALQSSDSTYASLESSITSLTSQRDSLATTIKNALNGAEFGNTPISSANASSWITQAQALISNCNSLLQSTDAGH